MKATALQAILAAATLSVATMGQASDLSGVPSGNYTVDPTHAYVTFTYSHLGLSNPILSFDDFAIDMSLDNEDPTKSSVSVTIEADSIVAGSDIWKSHLTGDKFFDTAKHPQITFSSTSVEAARDGSYKVMGDLVIKGQSKPVSIDVVINAAMNHPMSGTPTIGLAASAEVMRSEFGMKAAIPHVSDEVGLNITAEMVLSE